MAKELILEDAGNDIVLRQFDEKILQFRNKWLNKGNDDLSIADDLAEMIKEMKEIDKQKKEQLLKENFDEDEETVKKLQKELDEFDAIREKKRLYRKKWYENNREKHLTAMKSPILCECGTMTSKNKIYRHQQTTKHIKKMCEKKH